MKEKAPAKQRVGKDRIMKKIDLTLLEELINLLDKYNLTEIWYEEKDRKAGVKRELTSLKNIPSVGKESLKEGNMEENLVPIFAPMVGTFRQADSPAKPPLIEEGNVVEKNQVVGYIEAMKMLNEIKSKVKGKVIKVLVEEGQPVEYGQALFLVEPLP